MVAEGPAGGRRGGRTAAGGTEGAGGHGVAFATVVCVVHEGCAEREADVSHG